VKRLPPWALGALWLLPFLAGLVLRLWNLPDQILGGDEMHAVRAALALPLREILVTYRQADNCIPLTALYRLILDGGGQLSEIALRLPMLFTGCLLPVFFPWLWRRWIGRRAALLLAGLLAVSPVLVLYSRIARSYLPMLFLSLLAVTAFALWWWEGRRRWAVVYVVSAAGAVWFHLGAGPLVAAPFLYAVVDLLPLSRGGRAGARERGPGGEGLFLVGTAFAALLAAFLIPARESLAPLVASKHQAQPFPWAALPEVLRLQAGTGSDLLAGAFWLAALVGLALLFRDRPRLAAYTLVLFLGQVLGMVVLSPVGMANPWILSRYWIALIPLALLWIATLLARGPVGVSLGAGAALVLALVATGPFADPGFRSSSFMHHNEVAWAYAERALPLPTAASPFYHRLAREEGERAVIEYPWLFLWRFRSFYLYQNIHQRRAEVASPMRLLARPEVALRNTVRVDPAAFCASGARYLIVHTNIPREEMGLVRFDAPGVTQLTPEARRSLRVDARRLVKRLAAGWGDAVYADADVHVWDLDRTCAR
jgi:hypothetical protein